MMQRDENWKKSAEQIEFSYLSTVNGNVKANETSLSHVKLEVQNVKSKVSESNFIIIISVLLSY